LKPLRLDTAWPSGKILHWTSDRPDPAEIDIPADRDLYSYEADMVDRHIANRQAPAMSWDDSLGNMELLDAWRKEIEPGRTAASRA
jgi:hypothetical protein